MTTHDDELHRVHPILDDDLPVLAIISEAEVDDFLAACDDAASHLAYRDGITTAIGQHDVSLSAGALAYIAQAVRARREDARREERSARGAITQVEYRHLVSQGFNNVTVGAVATVEAGQTPQEALDALKAWVDTEVGAEHKARADLRAAQDRLSALQMEIGEKMASLDEMKRRWAAVRAFLGKHGVTTDLPIDLDDVPF